MRKELSEVLEIVSRNDWINFNDKFCNCCRCNFCKCFVVPFHRLCKLTHQLIVERQKKIWSDYRRKRFGFKITYRIYSTPLKGPLPVYRKQSLDDIAASSSLNESGKEGLVGDRPQTHPTG